MSPKTKHLLTHAGIVLLCLLISCAYFSPILGGKVLPQGDIQKADCMAKAQRDYHDATGDYTAWAPNMFSGMPGYQITNSPQQSIFTPVRNLLNLDYIGWSRHIGVLFLYLIGFYVALLAFGASPWLALLGALAFGLGSYNIIIIEAGHITKAWAMSMIAPILAGMVLTFRKKYLWGSILFFASLGLQITCNHLQITFYTIIGAVTLGLAYFIFALKDKQLKPFFTALALLVAGCALAFLCNLRLLMVNQEYVKYTMRGGKEITVSPNDLDPNAPASSTESNDKGLQIDYAFSWSYGVGETYTLLVPGAMGGGSGERVSQESEFYKATHQQMAPLYWGNQPFTSGPVYFGAIVCFLFLLGLFVVKGPERWWILAASLVAIALSWGSNFMPLNGWLFEHLPLYNKFRTPSMALVLSNVCMVILAVLALKAVLDKSLDRKQLNIALYCSTGLTVAILLVGMLLAGGFSFSGGSDMRYEQTMDAQQWSWLQGLLYGERKSLFMSDSWRSLLLVVAAAACLWLFINEKVRKPALLMLALTALIVGDLWTVDRRYLNEDNFTSESSIRIRPTETDQQISLMAAQQGEVDYRVMDLSTDTYNNSTPSAFHKQIGGYSAAKLRRYQDLIDFYINQNAVVARYYQNPQQGFDHQPVLDMLNCRYIVLPQGQIAHRNTACGNAWFVQQVQMVADANAEILALHDFDPQSTAIINSSEFAEPSFSFDSNATIMMQHDDPYNPNHCQYQTHCSTPQLALFSEIHYAPDWRAYIDGEPADYLRADYVLRALLVPAGDHTVEFRNEAPILHRLDRWTLIFSILALLIVASSIVLYYKRKEK